MIWGGQVSAGDSSDKSGVCPSALASCMLLHVRTLGLTLCCCCCFEIFEVHSVWVRLASQFANAERNQPQRGTRAQTSHVIICTAFCRRCCCRVCCILIRTLLRCCTPSSETILLHFPFRDHKQRHNRHTTLTHPSVSRRHISTKLANETHFR